jgi:hypothetical protein
MGKVCPGPHKNKRLPEHKVLEQPQGTMKMNNEQGIMNNARLLFGGAALLPAFCSLRPVRGMIARIDANFHELFVKISVRFGVIGRLAFFQFINEAFRPWRRRGDNIFTNYTIFYTVCLGTTGLLSETVPKLHGSCGRQ